SFRSITAAADSQTNQFSSKAFPRCSSSIWPPASLTYKDRMAGADKAFLQTCRLRPRECEYGVKYDRKIISETPQDSEP
ncbi:Hypothetical predicted protein, partial [Xyrichtys novacula]